MFNQFFIWCNKHDFFISGFVIGMNLIASSQSFNQGDEVWGYTSLAIALGLWYIYYKNVNKEKPKYME